MDIDRFAYSPMPERPALRWPSDARVAFWVIPNIEHFHLEHRKLEHPSADPKRVSGPVPDTDGFCQRAYGVRVGIWRMMDLFDKYGIRATVALNSDVCRQYPQIVRAGTERKWEWMGHAITNSEPIWAMDEKQERETIRTAVETLTAATGKAPRGWLSPRVLGTLRTPDILAEAGITYIADWNADDQPFPMRVKSGRMISLPYSRNLADIKAFREKGLRSEDFCQMICDQFDVLYAEGERSGRVLSISLHPDLSGHPYQVKWLDRALRYITERGQVWLATGGEIADWYYEHYYDKAPH